MPELLDLVTHSQCRGAVIKVILRFSVSLSAVNEMAALPAYLSVDRSLIADFLRPDFSWIGVIQLQTPLASNAVPPNPLEKPGYRLDFHDDFSIPTLDQTRWLPLYLPQWSSLERSRPNYRLDNQTLILAITACYRTRWIYAFV